MKNPPPILHKGSYFKVVLCGDGGVGKTSLIEHLVGKGFHSTYVITIGADITTYQTTIDGNECRFQFWDLAGQQRFDVVRSLYFRGSHGAFLVFDQTRPASLQNLESWKQELFRYAGKRIPLIILGNKSDLSRKINTSILQEFLDNTKQKDFPDISMEIPFYETSAQTGNGIPFVFEEMGRILLKYQELVST